MDFESDAVIARGKCGSWQAPLQVGPWPGHMTFGAFERLHTATWETADCTGRAQEVTARTFEALSTVSHWDVPWNVDPFELFVVELHGDLDLRLLY